MSPTVLSDLSQLETKLAKADKGLAGPSSMGLETTLGGLYPPVSAALVSTFWALNSKYTEGGEGCAHFELLEHLIIWKTKNLKSCTEIQENTHTMTMTEQHQPMYRTATIRKLKRTHEDTHNFDSNEFMRTSTLKSRSKPILRSASVIKTRHIKENLCSYGSYTDDQPENLIFRRGKCFLLTCIRKEEVVF